MRAALCAASCRRGRCVWPSRSRNEARGRPGWDGSNPRAMLPRRRDVATGRRRARRGTAWTARGHGARCPATAWEGGDVPACSAPFGAKVGCSQLPLCAGLLARCKRQPCARVLREHGGQPGEMGLRPDGAGMLHGCWAAAACMPASFSPTPPAHRTQRLPQCAPVCALPCPDAHG